jgi:hypothetical protein
LDQQPLVGINPVLVAEQYRDPKVREAVKAAAILAVHDSALEAARSRNAGRDWKGELQQARERFTDQVRSWVSRDGRTDGRLAPVLDSFVRRADKNVVKDLDKALKHAGVDQRAAEPLWKQFGELKSLEEKKQFLKDATTPTPGSGKTPQEHLRGVAAASGTSISPQTGGAGTSISKAAGLHLRGRASGTPGSQSSSNQQTGKISGLGPWRVPRQPGNSPPGNNGGPKR